MSGAPGIGAARGLPVPPNGRMDPGTPGLRSYQDLLRGRIEGDEARLGASAALLESEFMTTLFRTMRETVPEESPGAGEATDIFWSMLEREVADRVSLDGGYGIGERLRLSLARGEEEP